MSDPTKAPTMADLQEVMRQMDLIDHRYRHQLRQTLAATKGGLSFADALARGATIYVGKAVWDALDDEQRRQVTLNEYLEPAAVLALDPPARPPEARP